ncbi:response regulator [Salinisphaera aquimarina]|uniref:Response regulator n=1 Tax=Salinisphaera aquimarina TaxID=2094031 RepID=A0ABV7ETM4_9GAMM
MAEQPHILVVDDHRDIRDSLTRYLRDHGFRLSSAADAAAARRIVRDSALDLVVLDIMMPGEDGLSLCRWLRETTEIPVILLTAVADEMDRVIGLEMGADDYITKPFSPRELLARVRAVLRRATALPAQRDQPEDAPIRFDRWVFHAAQQELVGDDGVAVALSTGEYRMLLAFVRHPNRVLSREQLLDLTQGREAEVFDRSVDNQVSRLRRKIERDPANPRLIKTVWGGGYRFSATAADDGEPA